IGRVKGIVGIAQSLSKVFHTGAEPAARCSRIVDPALDPREKQLGKEDHRCRALALQPFGDLIRRPVISRDRLFQEQVFTGIGGGKSEGWLSIRRQSKGYDIDAAEKSREVGEGLKLEGGRRVPRSWLMSSGNSWEGALT